jgi:hypothetical protein
MTDKNDKVGQQNDNERLKGSKTDPQKTEMEGLKKGGVEPAVYPSDKKDATEKPREAEEKEEGQE